MRAPRQGRAPRPATTTMGPKYLLRFDDICPTMNWEIWDVVESILAEFDVRPILAVVPDNQDPHLRVAPPRPEFWDRVRRWQGKGFTIGLHGYQHVYVTQDAGILGLNGRSEFAGLPPEEQEAKVRAGLKIFEEHAVRAEVFVAPGHSFDRATLAALNRVGLRCLSDGVFFFPRVDEHGILWVPQQPRGLRAAPFGVWTVCFHHNEWTSGDAARFRADVERCKGGIAAFGEIASAYRGRRAGWMDFCLDRALAGAAALKRRLSR